jgi:uncharacterized SAM-binding protein YcdF (DUF218 family)
MFFVFSKILLFLLNPFLWLTTATILAFTLHSPFWRSRMKWVAVSIFLIFSNPFILGSLIRNWEDKATKIDEIGNYDIGVVLSGMMEYNRDVDRLTVRRGSDRIWQAITLYKKGKIKKILISGDSGYLVKDGLHEADQLKTLLLIWGIPNDDIIIENSSRNTHENALFTKKLIQKDFKNSYLLLITSSLHMKRASDCFRHEGLVFDTFSTDHYSVINKIFTLDMLIPSIDAFQLWGAFNKEWVGYFAYWLLDYL